MAAFVVDLDRLDDTVARLAARTTAVEDQLDLLDARIAALQAGWTGAAADAQLAAHQVWLVGAHEMRAGLTAIRSAAATAHAHYVAAVEANVRMWS